MRQERIAGGDSSSVWVMVMKANGVHNTMRDVPKNLRGRPDLFEAS